MAEAAQRKKPRKEPVARTPAEGMAFSMGHTIRWEIMAALHTGERSHSELAELVGEIPQTIGWHIKELAAAGFIELAEINKERQRIYRAVRADEYTDDEWEELPDDLKREHTALISLWLASEIFAAWQVGTMLEDPFLFMVWDWNQQLDRRGREEWKEERERSRKAKAEIAARSLERLAHSDEEPETIVYADLDFIRSPRVSGPPFRQR